MSMFDFIKKDANDFRGWQTRCFKNIMVDIYIGDRVPGIAGGQCDYQFEIWSMTTHKDSYAEVRNGILAEIDVPRDESLPLFDRFGNPVVGDVEKH